MLSVVRSIVDGLVGVVARAAKLIPALSRLFQPGWEDIG